MRQKLMAVDLSFYTPLLGLLLVLWLALHSATQFGQAGEATRQAVHMLVGGFVMACFTLLDYRHWRRLAWSVYLLTMLSLAAVLVVGHSVNGAQRWVSLGGLGAFQPSELAKFSSILVLATLLADGLTWRRLLLAVVAVGGPFLLIVVQPDLGTALVLTVLGAVMAYVAGLNGTLIFALGGLGAAALPLALKEYQRDRLLVFVNPDIDPAGMGYQLVQSQTAIGSGGFWGKGLLHGHMTQHGFVPENWTDFIFTVVGEELGFLGGIGLLACYAILFLLVIRAAYRSPDRFGSLLAVGFGTLLLFHVFVNIAMTVGLAPVVGIPLPFGSYGGTAIIVNMAGLGIVGSVRLQSRLPEQPLSDSHDPEHPSMELQSCVRGLAS
jgi:rod shape determining protein RodA